MNIIDFYNFVKNNEIQEIKIKKKNDIDNIENIEIFKNIFSNYLLRVGSTDNDSFLYSLLYLLDKDYYLFSTKEQNEYISALKKLEVKLQ